MKQHAKEQEMPDNKPSAEDQTDEISTQPEPDAAASVESPEQVQIKTLEEKIKTLEVQCKDACDQRLRTMAEMDNYRKRKDTESEQFKRYALEQYVIALLPVLDSFDRACEHTVASDPVAQEILNGFVLIQKQFHNVLEKMGVKPIEAMGKPFDHDLHQAVMQVEDQNVEPNTIVKELQRGYTLQGRVIKPAMVSVAASGTQNNNNNKEGE